MFRRVQRVLVAVSGGPDSVACLELLLRLRDQFGFEVCAAHFDHQLRDGSAEDLAWVRDFAKGHGLECLTGEGPVADVARKQGRGIEETARMMRYQFLAFAAEKLNADCIATGHTRDDQAETVLMHIARGSGVRGVRGMLPVAGVPGATERRLVRPLLETSRAETLATCAELGIAPRVDATNSDPSATRNRVRHETLEALRALNPGVTGALVGLAESAREAFAFIEKRSYETQPLERGPVGSIFALSALSALPGEALSLVLEREASFYHLEPEVNRTRIENARAVLARGSGSVRFGSVEMEASVGKVRVGPLLEEVEPLPVAVLNVPGATRLGPWRVDVLTAEQQATPESPVAAIGAIDGALRGRVLQPGDRIRVRGHTRKVQDLLVNDKVPAWEREGIVAVTEGDRLRAIFGATRTYVADFDGEPEFWVRLSPIPRPPQH